jgi:ABC-2 type transport system ATP-binding protein/lipopolysaccharide transport system ATP-binding protein
MSHDRPVIALRAVSLRYRLAKQRIPSLKEYAIHWMKGALAYEELWALRDVTLELSPGESLGIVGRNGAGKSTLLKVISGVLKPTRGSVTVEGTVAPILELGTGFDYELTGHENIYLNALLLGRARKEIDEKLDAIVEFSGLDEFIRSPIRNYSSGMLARLGFSIATAWVPDVLILDEVLSVGDARFLRRCERRLEEFREQGTTILLVSHAVEAVRENCQRAIWLDKGRIEADGPAGEVVDRYLAFSESG